MILLIQERSVCRRYMSCLGCTGASCGRRDEKVTRVTPIVRSTLRIHSAQLSTNSRRMHASKACEQNLEIRDAGWVKIEEGWLVMILPNRT